MMALKPWYTIVTPREDLIEGKPLDASEFAVHLDHVRMGKAPEDYINPERFFNRTYMTKSLLDMASQVVRRLNGITTETSPIFNLSTQFGGGKTHSLTFLYHLAKYGKDAERFTGVADVLHKAGVTQIPTTITAIFVGTEFSSINGRSEGQEPIRMTPWGEIAFQVGGIEGYEILKGFDVSNIAPGGDDLSRLFKTDTPYLILMDELLSYVSRHRNYNDLGSQFYNFMQTLTEFVRSRTNIVLAVSIPKSEIEMSEEDIADFNRLKKLLDRLGKAIMLSDDKETSQIIRRRLFEWYGLSEDAKKTISAYVTWMQENRPHITESFDVNNAQALFEATYPFHPQVLSLFERKWQSLPRFQQTRGALRLLALWVSKAYNTGFKKTLNDPLITLGTAPLDDPIFRAAVFEQMGENRLEAAITSDIAGKDDSHAIRLDHDAISEVKKFNLHRKIATIIFFESNGGQTREGLASIPEIKLSVGKPDFDIGHIDNAISSLLESCYYLTSVGNKYKFTTKENLQKRFNDRKASIKEDEVISFIESETRKQFEKPKNLEKIIFPSSSIDITDRPVLTLVIMKPNLKGNSETTIEKASKLLKEYGQSHRTYKSALIFAIPDKEHELRRQAIKYLAWEALETEVNLLNLEVEQINSIKVNVRKAATEMIEAIWKSYSIVGYLDTNNSLFTHSLGLLHTSQATSLAELYLRRLEADSIITQEISPNFISRNWPPAFTEWSTKSLRDTFYASPLYPRLINQEALKTSIVKGVQNGFLAYVGRMGFDYEPFYYKKFITEKDIEISDDMFIIKGEIAESIISPKILNKLQILSTVSALPHGGKTKFDFKAYDQNSESLSDVRVQWNCSDGEINSHGEYVAPFQGYESKIYLESGNITDMITVKLFSTSSSEVATPPPPPSNKETEKMNISWSGEVPLLKWMLFYSKILEKFRSEQNFKVKVTFEADIPTSSVQEKQEDLKQALKELGLDE